MVKTKCKYDLKTKILLFGSLILFLVVVLAPLLTGYTNYIPKEDEGEKIKILKSAIDLAVDDGNLVIDDKLESSELGNVLGKYLVSIPEPSSQKGGFAFNKNFSNVIYKESLANGEIWIKN